MNEQEIEQLKNDPQFQANLKALEEEIQKSPSIAKYYQLLDVYLALQEDEEKINELFQKILDTSFDAISNKLANKEKFDLSNIDELGAARGMYEYAIERFSQNDAKGAQEIFLALSHTIDDFEISNAMMLHAAAIAKGYTFDDFFNKLAKIDNIDFSNPKAVFVTEFAQPVDILLEMMKDEVKKLKERLSKLK